MKSVSQFRNVFTLEINKAFDFFEENAIGLA